jgi:hypothetical protein
MCVLQQQYNRSNTLIYTRRKYYQSFFTLSLNAFIGVLLQHYIPVWYIDDVNGLDFIVDLLLNVTLLLCTLTLIKLRTWKLRTWLRIKLDAREFKHEVHRRCGYDNIANSCVLWNVSELCRCNHWHVSSKN